MEAVLNELVSVEDLLVRPGPEGGNREIRKGGPSGEWGRGQTLLPASALPWEAELRFPAAPAASGCCLEVPVCPRG